MSKNERQDALKSRLIEFYDRYIPERSEETKKNVSRIIAKYADKPEKLFRFLRKKYADVILGVEAAEIDFESESFVPIRVLHRDDVVPPVPNAKIYDNLNKCRAILPEDDVHYVSHIPTGPIPRKSAAERGSNSSKSKYTYVYEDVAGCFSKGPMSILHDAFQSGAKIFIKSRAIAGERGTITGVVEAFDKHMNILLKHVNESYIEVVRGRDILEIVSKGYSLPRCLKGKRIDPERDYSVPVTRRISCRTLVRGDMVVSVGRVLDKKPQAH